MPDCDPVLMTKQQVPESAQPDRAKQAEEFRPRAQRFPIRTPLRYRESGQSGWQESTTINISRTGLLFRTDENVAVKTILEFQIVFPAEVTGGDPMNVVCWGPVVRRESPSPAGTDTALAAAILHYRFKRH